MTIEEIVDVPLFMDETKTVDVGRHHLGPAFYPRQIRVGMTQSPQATITVEFVYYVDPDETTQPEPIEGGERGVVHYGKHSGRVMRAELYLPGRPVSGRLKVSMRQLGVLAAALSTRAAAMDPISRPSRQHLDVMSSMMPWIADKLESLRDRQSYP